MPVKRSGIRNWPSRETKFSGANEDRKMKILIFPVLLTMSRIGNLTRLIHTLLPGICDNHRLQYERAEEEELLLILVTRAALQAQK